MEQKNNSNYGINDIESLSFKDGVRKRIAMYLGSAEPRREFIFENVDFSEVRE